MRRKSGTSSVAKTIKAMPANVPLIKNLGNPEYLSILLNGRASPEERFADIDIHMVRRELRNLQDSPAKVPGKIRKLIKRPNLPNMLVALLLW